jgi:hypothetical protein
VLGRALKRVLPAAVTVAALALPQAGVARTADSSLQVTYVGTSSLQLVLNGSAVGAGATVPAGSYTILVDDADYTTPRFVMTGPGVSINSDLNSTGMGIDRPATFGPFTLQPNATYTARDANMGASLTFGTGASSGGSTSGGGSTSVGGSTSGGGTSSSGGSSSASGSAAAKRLGTLTGSISAAGKAALSFGGKPVKSLKAGLYTLSIADHSKKAGFVVQKLGFPAMKESGAATVGSHTVRLTLSPGKWFFTTAPAGAKTYFTVTG